MDELPLEKRVWRVRMRHWWKVVLFLQVFLISLMSGCLATKKWVRQGSKEFKWEGGLLKCFNCIGYWDNLYYHEIVAKECHMQGLVHNSWCNQFSDLRYAGRAFISLDLFCIAVLLLWVAKTVAELYQRKFLRDWLFPVLGLIATAAHIAATIQWSVVTEAFFYGDCYHLSDGSDRANMCALDGPGLAVVNCIYLPLLTAFWVALKVKSAPPKLVEEKELEEIVPRIEDS